MGVSSREAYHIFDESMRILPRILLESSSEFRERVTQNKGHPSYKKSRTSGRCQELGSSSRGEKHLER